MSAILAVKQICHKLNTTSKLHNDENIHIFWYFTHDSGRDKLFFFLTSPGLIFNLRNKKDAADVFVKEKQL